MLTFVAAGLLAFFLFRITKPLFSVSSSSWFSISSVWIIFSTSFPFSCSSSFLNCCIRLEESSGPATDLWVDRFSFATWTTLPLSASLLDSFVEGGRLFFTASLGFNSWGFWDSRFGLLSIFVSIIIDGFDSGITAGRATLIKVLSRFSSRCSWWSWACKYEDLFS